jgi:hypothetical protein
MRALRLRSSIVGNALTPLTGPANPPLTRFPLLGTGIVHGRWSGYRFMFGPWRWLVVLYKYDAESDTVMVASFVDGRSSTACTSSR